MNGQRCCAWPSAHSFKESYAISLPNVVIHANIGSHVSLSSFSHFPLMYTSHPFYTLSGVSVAAVPSGVADQWEEFTGGPIGMLTTPNTLMGEKQSHRPQTSSKQQTTGLEMYALSCIWPRRYNNSNCDFLKFPVWFSGGIAWAGERPG